MSTYVDIYNGDDSIPVFLAFLIEEYKNYKGIPGEEAASRLYSAGVIEHFAEYYDVLHTQGTPWLMQEIDNFIANKK